MLLSPGLFLLLLSGLQAVAPERDVQAMVGSDVRLGCVYPGGSSFDLNDLFVYWQISGSNTVVAYFLSGNSSVDHVDSRYRSRAHVSGDSMRQGDFSLLLQDVTPDDAQTFRCLVFRKSLKLGKVLEVEIRLHVAANYSMPVVSSPGGGPGAWELTFTCTSTNGYPRPKVYWINKTDNSLLPEALQNHTVSVNAWGLYDVVSVLTLPHTPGVDVGCCIENELLSQNLTGSSQALAASRGAGELFTESPTGPAGRRRLEVSAIAIALPVLVVAAAVTSCLGLGRCRRRCPRHPGDQTVTPEQEQELPDQAAQSLCPGHRPGSGRPPAGRWTQLKGGLSQGWWQRG
ncbi:ICOS ligand isoform X2 [Dipodomys spectabilis]|uniref:ICOS ligand isoform X2 n=1 Tax=Dipodomys spectabilis TaxID=105255 RepID=UPI001C5379D9|nr:ICOS ligand isoform X2 [Dipodomys spectabilis]